MTRIAVLISFSGAGGVERMVLNLIDGFAAHGVAVDLLAIRAESAHLGALPEGVRMIDLGTRHSTLAIPALARYLAAGVDFIQYIQGIPFKTGRLHAYQPVINHMGKLCCSGYPL